MKTNTFFRHLKRIAARKRFTVNAYGLIRDRYGRCPLCSVANALDSEFKSNEEIGRAIKALQFNDLAKNGRYLAACIADAADNEISEVDRNARNEKYNAVLRKRILRACGLKERKVK